MATQEPAALVRSKLPWLIGLAALVLYLVTLNHWISVSSLQSISQVTDPTSPVPLTGPLFYLLTRPFRWLPIAAQIPALNWLSAFCAAGVLALLARCTALLPHDRTREERCRISGEHGLLTSASAWLPPVVAALVCGLQLTFWEHATAASGEMFDLLCFAYVVRCLLEFRIDRQDSWLFRLAFVYGLATTNNWAMIGFFPACLAALIWIKGRDFFRVPLLLGLLLCGLSALLLYLLLPVLGAMDPKNPVGFWPAFRIQLATQKSMLFLLPRWITLLGAMPPLVLLAFIGVRWPSSSGDTSVVGNLLGTYVFRFVYAVLLLAGFWVAFDAPFSPRLLTASHFGEVSESGLSVPFLSCYFLGALALGYYVGYLLLVFSRVEEHTRRRVSAGHRLLGQAATVLVWVLCLAAAAALLWRNLPTIRANNGMALRDFAESAASQLPARDAVVLSDQAQMLALLQVFLNQQRAGTNHLLVASRFLEYAVYQKTLNTRSPHLWPRLVDATNDNLMLGKAFVMYELADLASTRNMYYLHPSFGYFFEPSYQEPYGLLSHLRSYQTNQIAPPTPSPEVVQTNVDFWTAVSPKLQRLTPLVARGVTDARLVGRWYSLALNRWGVELQRLPQPRLAEAARSFKWALELNPGNVAAEINLEFNRAWQSGKTAAPGPGQSPEDRFGSRFRSWPEALRSGGPIDDPRYALDLGRILTDQTLNRQAAVQLLRAVQLEPTNLAARIALVRILVGSGLNDQALEILGSARAAIAQANPDQRITLVQLESQAWQGKGQWQTGERLILQALQETPGNRPLIESLIALYLAADLPDRALEFIQAQLARQSDPAFLLLSKALICMNTKQYEAASQALRQILSRQPQHPQALLTQGALAIQTGQFTNALPPLDTLLKLEPGYHAARLNRAIARLQAGLFDAAQEDYLALLEPLPKAYAVRFGLGEIAWRRHDTAKAIEHYEAYLVLAPPETDESKQVRERLRQLKSGKAPN